MAAKVNDEHGYGVPGSEPSVKSTSLRNTNEAEQPAGVSLQTAHAWVAEREDQIKMCYPPGYSLQLTPDERLNAGLKQETTKRVPVRTKARLGETANDHIATLEQNPQRVMSYFQDRRVR